MRNSRKQKLWHIDKNKNKIDGNTNNSVKKWSNNLNRHSFKQDIQMANNHMERRSKSLIVRVISIKIT